MTGVERVRYNRALARKGLKIGQCRHTGDDGNRCPAVWVYRPGDAGRPQSWCEEHGSPKYAMRRSRAEGPKAPKPPCCPTKGRCPQHKHGVMKHYLKTPWAEESKRVLDDLCDVWGMGQIWDRNGYPIASFRALDD